MEWFFLFMVAFPEVQKKAQAELDEVVGREQMPTFEHYERLPYVRALIDETMRIKPVAPLGVPHRLTQDDVYEGYHIPKGAICIANIWQVQKIDMVVYLLIINGFAGQ